MNGFMGSSTQAETAINGDDLPCDIISVLNKIPNEFSYLLRCPCSSQRNHVYESGSGFWGKLGRKLGYARCDPIDLDGRG